MLPSGPHDEFLELCAVSTSGHLSDAEQKRLQEHLAICSECRDALRDFESVVHDTIPAIGAEQAAEQSSRIDPGPAWSQPKVEKAFFERLAREEGGQSPEAEKKNGVSAGFRRILPIAPESTWRHVWMLYAAGILLFITLCCSAYWVGVRHGTQEAKFLQPATQTLLAARSIAFLEEKLSDTGHQLELARQQMADRERALAELRKEVEKQSAENESLQDLQRQLQNNLSSSNADKRSLIEQQAELERKAQSAEGKSRTLETRIGVLTGQLTEGAAHVRLLETKISNLTVLLEDRDSQLKDKDELLAHDRDIRELMGARDLYIAEVHDVARNGKTAKPYGRVFYTRGRSLIFYAYDLDEHAAFKTSSSFQAWGRKGPDQHQALNLGVFYEDSATNKRWILKCDDPRTLEQIDAVFVTVEPNGGSIKPSGPSLLFAYLKFAANHP